jgi:hypothetical protein
MKAVRLAVLLLLLLVSMSAAEQTFDISEMPERAVFEESLSPLPGNVAGQAKSSR